MARSAQNTRKKNRRVAPKRASAKQQQGAVLPFITGICVGLFIAFVVYLKVLNKPDQADGHVDANKPAAGEEVIETASDKPKFDFYTILPEREVKVPEWEPPPAVDPATLDPQEAETVKQQTEAGTYVFQVGSFQSMQDADSVKARLIMLGFPVEIQRVVINGQKVWFRVRVGPYSEAGDLNRVRQRLSQNNMDYILLRIKDEG